MDGPADTEIAQFPFSILNPKRGLGFLQLREALEAAWDEDTSYRGAVQEGNPALGQCYPTTRVMQRFFPNLDIAHGTVWTGEASESHFWNVLSVDDVAYHIDLTWQQFPCGSRVTSFEILDRDCLADSHETVERCNRLEERVLAHLNTNIATEYVGSDHCDPPRRRTSM
jgi:hypothetical protein